MRATRTRHGGNRSGRQFRLSVSVVLRFFPVGNRRRELKRGGKATVLIVKQLCRSFREGDREHRVLDHAQAELANADRDQLFARNRRLGERYAERVLCVASHVACGVVPLQPSGAGLAS